MARVTVENGELRVKLEGLHKIWALRRTITVPLAHVQEATVRSKYRRRVERFEGAGHSHPWRLRGGHIPQEWRKGLLGRP